PHDRHTFPTRRSSDLRPAGQNAWSKTKGIIMGTITVKDGTTIYYKDWGTGQPVVFSHGWPLSADAWEDQMIFLADRGYRCIAHRSEEHTSELQSRENL